MIFCGECGTQLADGYSFCLNCGTKVVRSSMPVACPKCGNPILKNNKFCGNCGWQVGISIESEPKEEVSVQKTQDIKMQQQTDASKPIRPIICELCGGNNLIKDNGLFCCQNCGTKYSLEEARKMMIEGTVRVAGTVRVDNSEKISNFLMMANSAYSVENYKEAEEYANRVIEVDPKNTQAWFIKGKSAGWQSTLDKLRINECIQCWGNCVNYASPNDAVSYKHKIAEEIAKLNKAVVAIKVDLFSNNPSEHNAKQLVDISDLIQAGRNLTLKTQIPSNEKGLREMIAINMYNAAIKGFDYANVYFGKRPQDMNSIKYPYWIEYVDNCIAVLSVAMDIAENETTLNNLYDKAVYMHKTVSNSQSYRANGQGYVVDLFLDRKARAKRRDLIYQLGVKKSNNLQRIRSGSK